MALACLARIAEILGAHDGASASLERKGIDDRAVDLWSQLLAVAFVADAKDGGNRGAEILDAARDAGSQREAHAEAAHRLLGCAGRCPVRARRDPAPAELLEALPGRPGWDG